MSNATTMDVLPVSAQSPMSGAGSADRLPPRTVAAFVAMCFGMFMAILDIQIVSASLSEIQAGLSASADEIPWVQTSYLIAEVIAIPLSGFLSRALGTRLLFTVAAAGFTFTSFMCGMSSSIDGMILWRALQGFIGGGMVPTVFASAYVIFAGPRQKLVAPVVGLIATLAPTIGPTVGGYVTDALSWHWLFFINIVPGLIVTVASALLIDFDRPDLSLFAHFDGWGLISMAAFLGALEYVLTARAPIVDLRAFANRNFAIGSLFSFVLGMGLYGLTFLYPVYLAQIRGYDALMIGKTMFVSGLAMFVSAPLAGQLSQKIDPRCVLVAGFLLFAAGTWQMTSVTEDWDFWELLWPQVFRGVGLMFAIVPVTNTALGTLPAERMKNASGLFNLMRNLGGAIGLAMINTALNERMDLHLARLHEAVTWSRVPAVERLDQLTRQFQGSDAPLMALKELTIMVRRQAGVMSFADVFLMLTVLFGALAAAGLVMRRPRSASSGATH